MCNKQIAETGKSATDPGYHILWILAAERRRGCWSQTDVCFGARFSLCCRGAHKAQARLSTCPTGHVRGQQTLSMFSLVRMLARAVRKAEGGCCGPRKLFAVLLLSTNYRATSQCRALYDFSDFRQTEASASRASAPALLSNLRHAFETR